MTQVVVRCNACGAAVSYTHGDTLLPMSERIPDCGCRSSFTMSAHFHDDTFNKEKDQ